MLDLILGYPPLLSALHEYVIQYLNDFLGDEGHGPGEDVHVVGQHERMLRVIVLLYLNLIVLEPQHRRLVVIYVAVIRRTENGNDGREFGRAVPLVKLVPVHLDLMGSHHTEKVVHL